MPKFLDSFVFRLALGYTATVVGVIALTYIFSYVAIDRLLDRDMRQAILVEADHLRKRYEDTKTVEALTSVVRGRHETREDAVYLLYTPPSAEAPDPRLLYGLRDLIDVTPDPDGWLEMTLRPPPEEAAKGQETRVVVGLLTQVDTFLWLIVGRDLKAQHRVKDLLFRAMLSGLGVTSALGLAGGAIAAQRMMRRVERARRAAEDIMTGDLKRRLPLAGHDDELERLTLTLNQMLDRIERLVGAMREVTDDVAHDLRTPLTRLRARAERALQNPKSGETEMRAALEECVQEADRLLAIFRAILSIARLKTQAGANPDHPEIDLSQAVADAAELYEPVLEEAGFALRLDIAPHLRIRGERALIGQALANLIENAMHYGAPPQASGRAPEILLRLAPRGGRIELSVSDRGPGVPPDKREAVFSRFSRLDPSRAEEGVGLGLAFVRAVAEAHGGSARIEDAAPGAKVTILLPNLPPTPPPQTAERPASARLSPAETL